jgi:hypothetical protein
VYNRPDLVNVKSAGVFSVNFPSLPPSARFQQGVFSVAYSAHRICARYQCSSRECANRSISFRRRSATGTPLPETFLNLTSAQVGRLIRPLIGDISVSALDIVKQGRAEPASMHGKQDDERLAEKLIGGTVAVMPLVHYRMGDEVRCAARGDWLLRSPNLQFRLAKRTLFRLDLRIL